MTPTVSRTDIERCVQSACPGATVTFEVSLLHGENIAFQVSLPLDLQDEWEDGDGEPGPGVKASWAVERALRDIPVASDNDWTEGACNFRWLGTYAAADPATFPVLVM